MQIKAFSEATSLSRDTINFYLKLGLIQAKATRSSTNRYRQFDEDQVEAVRMIVQAKALGFTLAEIRDLARRYRKAGADAEVQRKLLGDQLERLRARRDALDALEKTLRAKLKLLETKRSRQ